MRDSTLLDLRELPKSTFPRTWDFIRAGVEEGVAPGIVAGFAEASRPGEIYVAHFGKRRIFPTVEVLHAETIFDLASLSKVIATTALVAALVDRGWLDFETPVSAFFPNYFPGKKIQIKHLLSHTAGFVAVLPFFEMLEIEFKPSTLTQVSVEQRQKKMRELVFKIAPETQPGERTLYSDISFLILGFVLESLTGKPLDQAVQTYVWNPMGARGFAYHRVTKDAEQGRIDGIAATEDSAWRGGVLQGQVHDDNTWAMGGYAGQAGVFGSIRDVLFFASRLLNGYFSTTTTRAMWTRFSPNSSRTLGWDTPSGPETSARGFSPNAVGHLGYTGTSLWIEPERGLSVALLTNRVHPSRENWKIKEFRPKFHEILRAEIDSSPNFK